MPTKSVALAVRALGARQAAREIDSTSLATRRLGSASRVTSGQMRVMGGATDAVGRSMRSLETWTKRGAVGITALGLAGAKVGLDFNSRMEQSRVAMTNLLGSQQQAQTMLNQLVTLAAKTPFETQPLIASTQKLLGFGMAADKVVPTMRAIGDAVAGVGGSSDTIDRVTIAIGQMQAKGKVQSDELLQLAEAGVPAYKLLGDQLHLTGRQLSDSLKAGAISANKGIPALIAGIQKKYAGMADAQSKTFQGQISTLRDYATMTAGTITEPLFKSLETKVLPRMTDFTQQVNKIWARRDLDFEGKFKLTTTAATPLINDLMESLKRARIDEKFADVIAWTVPQLSKAAQEAGPPIAEGLWRGFKAAPIWAKVVGAGIVLRALGLGGGGRGGRVAGTGPFGSAGTLAAATFRQGFDAGITKLSTKGGVIGKVATFFAGRGSTPTNPLYVVDVAGGAGVPGAKKGAGKVADVAKKVATAAAPVAARAARVGGPAAIVTGAGVYFYGQAQQHRDLPTRGPAHARREEAAIPRGFPTRRRDVLAQLPHGVEANPPMHNLGLTGHLAAGGVVHQAGVYEVGERGSERLYLPEGAEVEPHQHPTVLHLHNVIELDGKVVAESVRKQVIRKASTR